MKKASFFVSATFAVFAGTAHAQDTYPEVTTPEFSENIKSTILNVCPNGIYDQEDIPASIQCADVTLEATSALLQNLSTHIEQETGKSISYFWAGAAQGELLYCANALDSARNNSHVTVYDIQRGDTLSEIVADTYSIDEWNSIEQVYETVARNNRIANPDLISEGDKIVLFKDPQAAEIVGPQTSPIITHLSRAHDASVSCVKNFYNAENGIGQWVDTPALNNLIDLLNCQVNPADCVYQIY